MLKRVYDILRLFREYVVFGFLLLLSIALLTSNDTPQIRVLRTVTVFSIASLQNALGFIPNYFNLRNENAVLREQNLVLADEVSRLREASLENLRLRQLLGLKTQEAFRYVAANVVGRNPQLLRNTLIVDVGSADGIQENMPVVTDGGLVGKITSTTSRYATAELLLSLDLRVSAMDERSRVAGIVQWTGGKTLQLQDVAKTLDLRIGDAIITSDFSSLFPAGIRIGVVSGTRQAPGSLFQTVEVMPGVDFSTLEEVFVVLSTPDSGRVALERRMHD